MHKTYPENVRGITATIGGKTYHYRSEGEFMWAQYLEFLKLSKKIADWEYEPRPFFFKDVTFGPVQYKLDFLVKGQTNFIRPKEPDYCQEFKRGHLDGPAVTKLRRMAEQYPDVLVELVMMNMPKKQTHRMAIACKYTRDNRIVDASLIFRQMGKLIMSAKDYRMAEKLSQTILSLFEADNESID